MMLREVSKRAGGLPALQWLWPGNLHLQVVAPQPVRLPLAVALLVSFLHFSASQPSVSAALRTSRKCHLPAFGYTL